MMSNALLIAARDVRDRGRLFLIAAVLACIPFLATLLPTSRGHATDVITALAGFLSLSVGLGLSLALGVTTIGSDLSSRRLSYWFSKPITPAALWAGKAAAALFTSFACFSIIAVPAMLAARTTIVLRYGENWKLPTALISSMVVLFLVSHVASTMVRSRSAVLGLDLVALLIAISVLAAIMKPLLFHELFLKVLAATAVLILVVLLVAPYWQLANGRTDARRSHFALSRALWTGVAIVLVLVGGVVLWSVSARPSDFDRIISLHESPAGNAVFVRGSAPQRRGVNSLFVVNPATGESDRIALPPYWALTFSRDGKFAAWVEPSLMNWGRGDIVIRDLTTKENHPLGPEANLGATVVFSDDNERVAVRDRVNLSVFERKTGRLLAATQRLRTMTYTFWFPSPDVVRIVTHYATGREALPVEIAELDVRTKSVKVVGQSVPLSTFNQVSVSADGSRMLLRANHLLVDGRTGATIAQLAPAESSPWYSGLLSDGRAVTCKRVGKGTRVVIYSRDGVLQHELTVPTAAWIAGEQAGGKLLLRGLRPEPMNDASGRGRSMIIVDANRGVVERVVNDIRGDDPDWAADPRLVRYAANVKLAGVDANGKLTYWN